MLSLFVIPFAFEALMTTFPNTSAASPSKVKYPSIKPLKRGAYASVVHQILQLV